MIEAIFKGQCSTLSDKEIREIYDKRSSLQKTRDLSLSVFHEIKDCLKRAYQRTFDPSPLRHHPDKKVMWKEDSEGLVVLIHGLFDDPSSWKEHVELLRKNDKLDIFVPYVPHRGNCSLEEASREIIQRVREYAEQHPRKKIVLIGHSNGSRIVDAIDQDLRILHPRTPVKISTIAGVHFGSPWLNLGRRLHLDKVLPLNQSLWLELSYGSDKACEIMAGLSQPVGPHVVKRSLDCYASTEDLLVPLIDSSLPANGIEDAYFHVENAVGHCALVSRVAPIQVQRSHDWIKA